jgi:hypothetical protein
MLLTPCTFLHSAHQTANKLNKIKLYFIICVLLSAFFVDIVKEISRLQLKQSRRISGHHNLIPLTSVSDTVS